MTAPADHAASPPSAPAASSSVPSSRSASPSPKYAVHLHSPKGRRLSLPSLSQPSSAPRPLQRLTRKLLLLLALALLASFALYARHQTHSPFLARLAGRPAPRTLDIVVAYYDLSPEGVSHLQSHLANLRSYFEEDKTEWEVSAIIYQKGDVPGAGVLLRETGAKAVVGLENVGREGGTYLHHIIDNYNHLADLTLFVQHHLGWEKVAAHRLPQIQRNTGFISLGPYYNATCETEHRSPGDDFTIPRIRDIWEEFHPTEPCESNLRAITWAGQFAASRSRIRMNSVEKYEWVMGLLEAPKGDAIYKEGGTRNAPWFGHSLERSWPAIMHCSEPRLGLCRYTTDDPALCACADEEEESQGSRLIRGGRAWWGA